MRRTSKTYSHKLSADSQKLVALAQSITQAGSRLEERAWERRLDALLHRLLKSHHQETVDAALEHAFKLRSPAYDALMDSVETVSESSVIEHEDGFYDCLLIAAPVLAWTRFAISSTTVPQEAIDTLIAHLHGHVLASDTQLAISPHLYSIDQLPRSHAETFALTQLLARSALKKTAAKGPAHPAETVPFLADTRYLLACVAVKAGEPVFAWQENASPANGREHALEQWRAQATPNVAKLLPGCGVELLLPDAYHVACREADKQIRPVSIKAAVNYLTNALGVEADMLHASIGGFGADPTSGRVDEYRIGFLLRNTPDVVYGVVWPLYGQEEEDEPLSMALDAETRALLAPITGDELTPLEEILALLRACGMVHIKHHKGCFSMESCEDCGAALFPDLEGELAHAEMPEDMQQNTGHFH